MPFKNPQDQKDYDRARYLDLRRERLAQVSTWYQNNRERALENGRRWFHDNRSVADAINRRSHLKRYGITPERYDALLAAQGGHCAICSVTEPGGRRKFFCVDHDHETGEIRGLLCHSCNAAIGMFKESLELIQNAATYLIRSRP